MDSVAVLEAVAGSASGEPFGFGATGNPVGFWPSLLARAVCYSVQGFSLSMSFVVPDTTRTVALSLSTHA